MTAWQQPQGERRQGKAKLKACAIVQAFSLGAQELQLHSLGRQGKAMQSSRACASAQAFDLGAQEVQLQSWGSTAEDLFVIGELLARIDARIVVKLPITRAGTAVAAQLVALGTRVTLTGALTGFRPVLGTRITLTGALAGLRAVLGTRITLRNAFRG